MTSEANYQMAADSIAAERDALREKVRRLQADIAGYLELERLQGCAETGRTSPRPWTVSRIVHHGSDEEGDSIFDYSIRDKNSSLVAEHLEEQDAIFIVEMVNRKGE